MKIKYQVDIKMQPWKHPVYDSEDPDYGATSGELITKEKIVPTEKNWHLRQVTWIILD